MVVMWQVGREDGGFSGKGAGCVRSREARDDAMIESKAGRVLGSRPRTVQLRVASCDLQVLRAKEVRYIEYRRSLARRADGMDDEETPLQVIEPLSAAEEANKEQLLTQGFLSWSKKDFQAFVRGCEVQQHTTPHISYHTHTTPTQQCTM